MNESSASVSCAVGGRTQTYRFTGVTAVEHFLSLSLDDTSSQGADVINGARNRPDRVTLSVIETDAAGAGRAAGMLEQLERLKRERILCRVATAMGTYGNMLLTEITATRDAENQCGWQGSLVFVKYVPAAEGNAAVVKMNNNSSTRKNTGSTGARKIDGGAFAQLLKRAGVEVNS